MARSVVQCSNPVGTLVVILSLLWPAVDPVVTADDWPRWRGPSFNGYSHETQWLDKWPSNGPPVVWTSSVGTGFSSLVINNGRVFTIGNEDDVDTVVCLGAADGHELWKQSYACPLDANLFEGGPTATPAVDGDLVYTLSRRGDLICFHALSGEIVWSRDLPDETGVPIPTWGFASSPLVHEETVLVNAGGGGMAFEKTTGRILWKSESTEAGYTSPVPMRHDGEWHAVLGTAQAIVAVRVRDGREVWSYRWITRFGINAADPIPFGSRVFVSSGYGKGASLLDVSGSAPKQVWRSREMRNQFTSSIRIGDFVYGFDGDAGRGTRLRCLDLQSGKPRWTVDDLRAGALIAANNRLIVLAENGELLVAVASPASFRPSARARILKAKCWTAPALANGFVFCRNAAGDVACVDVRKTTGGN